MKKKEFCGIFIYVSALMCYTGNGVMPDNIHLKEGHSC